MSTLKSGLVITCLSTADNFGVRRSLLFASAGDAGGESGGDPLSSLDGRYVSSVSETQLDTLCIQCIWNFMRRLHMTSVSSVCTYLEEGRDTQCI